MGQTSISRVVSRSIKFPSIPKGPSSSSPSNSGHYHSPHSSGGSNGVAGLNRDSHNRSGSQVKTLKAKSDCMTRAAKHIAILLSPYTRGQCRQRALPDSSPTEKSSRPYRGKEPTSGKTAQPDAESSPTTTTSFSTWFAPA